MAMAGLVLTSKEVHSVIINVMRMPTTQVQTDQISANVRLAMMGMGHTV